MENWHTSAEPLELPRGASFFKPLSLQVEAGTGNVQVQRLQSDGTTWSAIEDEGTLTASGVYLIERANGPALKIVATGNAKFAARGM